MGRIALRLLAVLSSPRRRAVRRAPTTGPRGRPAHRGQDPVRERQGGAHQDQRRRARLRAREIASSSASRRATSSYAERLAACKTAEDFYQLGLWCEEQKLKKRAEEH